MLRLAIPHSFSRWVVHQVASDCDYSKILIPKYIGCGLAGGDWNIVSEIIEEVFIDKDVLIVDFDGSKIAKIQK